MNKFEKEEQINSNPGRRGKFVEIRKMINLKRKIK